MPTCYRRLGKHNVMLFTQGSGFLREQLRGFRAKSKMVTPPTPLTRNDPRAIDRHPHKSSLSDECRKSLKYLDVLRGWIGGPGFSMSLSHFTAAPTSVYLRAGMPIQPLSRKSQGQCTTRRLRQRAGGKLISMPDKTCRPAPGKRLPLVCPCRARW
jgi:hypothetical protein